MEQPQSKELHAQTAHPQKIRTQDEWIARAREVLPGGGFGNFDPNIIIARGEGARVWDEDGREYVDYLIGSGPMLLGHGHPEVMEAVLAQLPRGMTFFATNAKGIELAEAIVEACPCCEQVRFVASGGEADMYAMRLARAYTGKDKILKFEGGYHGMSAEAQMSLAPAREVNFPQALPDSAGIPSAVADQMLIAPFNDLEAVASLLAEHDDVAAIIVEPLQRVIPAAPAFLEGLRRLCDAHGALLIFDEIVTGFRLAYGGAQERYGVTPDLCTLGKIIGGGFALAATGGRAEIMAHFDKARVGAEGWLMQLGTLSGAPVAAAAGLKTMEILRREGVYERLRATGERLQRMQSAALNAVGAAHQIVGDPTLFDIFFTEAVCADYRTTKHQRPDRGEAYNAALRAHGVFKSPSKLYPCLALNEEDLALTERAVQAAAAAVARAQAA
ncbi:MAG: aminotransferase class III-fold pyridoxal phosphate-dependent enzyme [Pseudomonadota bacterium]